MGSGVQLLTNAVTVGEPKNAFHLVEGHVLLDLYHIPVEAGAGAVEEIGRSCQCWQTDGEHSWQEEAKNQLWDGTLVHALGHSRCLVKELHSEGSLGQPGWWEMGCQGRWWPRRRQLCPVLQPPHLPLPSLCCMAGLIPTVGQGPSLVNWKDFSGWRIGVNTWM